MTGDRWFAKVPDTWQVKPTKRILQCIDVKVDAATTGLDYIGLENVQSWTGKVLFSEERYQSDGTANRFCKGDVLFGKLRPYLAKVLEADQDGICSTEFLVLRSEHVSSRFLRYAMLTNAFIDAANAWTYGVKMPRASWENIGHLLMPVPPRGLQIAIADFLDRETSKADAVIAKYEQLIQLLDEKRAALVAETTIRGLSSDAMVKPSGVDWIGNIPTNSSVARLRFLCAITTGSKDTVDAIDSGEYAFFVRSQTMEHIGSYSFDCEAVLTAGDGVGVGKVFHHYTGKFEAHQRVYVLSSFRGVTGRFLYYYLAEHFARVALEGAAKSTVDSLRMPVFLNFPVVVHDEHTQTKITETLDRACYTISTLRSKAESAIATIREHRAALITAAVTGQIDVSTYRSKHLDSEEIPA